MKAVRRWVVMRLDGEPQVVATHDERLKAVADAERHVAETGVPHTAIVQIVSASIVITEFDQLRFRWLKSR